MQWCCWFIVVFLKENSFLYFLKEGWRLGLPVPKLTILLQFQGLARSRLQYLAWNSWATPPHCMILPTSPWPFCLRRAKRPRHYTNGMPRNRNSVAWLGKFLPIAILCVFRAPKQSLFKEKTDLSSTSVSHFAMEVLCLVVRVLFPHLYCSVVMDGFFCHSGTILQNGIEGRSEQGRS